MNTLLHDLLSKSSATYPDKTAVIDRDRKMSYRELNDVCDRLSSFCISKGVQVGDRIGIYIDKSIESVMAVFGILKTGACYVPLDPMAPVERHKLIIDDCSLKYMVTTSKKLRHVKQLVKHCATLEYVLVTDIERRDNKIEVSDVTLLFKDDIFQAGNTENIGSSLNNEIRPDNIAYILYTSGSTGQPKGVMLSHSAAMAFVEWSGKTFDVRNDDTVSSHAPFHFDLSVFDIYVTVMAGASLCLVPQGLSSFPKSVVEFINKNGITVWYSVPSILIQLILHGDLENQKLPSLRLVLFAGEVFHSKYLAMLMELIPHPDFYNLYGPTETNVITYYNVKEPPSDDKTIPIGLLCDGVTSYIVDDSGALVGEGETGELYVSCPTLMHGYWNDQKKTDGVLFKNSFDESKGMIYKTGDLVHWNEKGELEYHGRCDAMIKSRGYRIELGEVEASLSLHSGLKEAAVTAVPDDEIGSRIKAVIAPKNAGEITENDIKLFCSKKLPHYMVPDIISIVDSLPRTSTGKIDRKKLKQSDI